MIDMSDLDILLETVNVLRKMGSPSIAAEICNELKKRKIEVCFQKLGNLLAWSGGRYGINRRIRYRRFNREVWEYYLG